MVPKFPDSARLVLTTCHNSQEQHAAPNPVISVSLRSLPYHREFAVSQRHCMLWRVEERACSHVVWGEALSPQLVNNMIFLGNEPTRFFRGLRPTTTTHKMPRNICQAIWSSITEIAEGGSENPTFSNGEAGLSVSPGSRDVRRALTLKRVSRHVGSLEWQDSESRFAMCTRVIVLLCVQSPNHPGTIFWFHRAGKGTRN